MIDYDSVALVTNAGVIDIPVKYPTSKDKFVNKGLSGLGPPPIDVMSTQTIYPGAINNGTHVQSREIVLTLGMNAWVNGNGSYHDLRAELYSILGGNPDGSLLFGLMKSGNPSPVAWTRGNVSLFEMDISTDEPTVQITIQCGNPYFQADSFDSFTIADFTLVSSTYKSYSIVYDNSKGAPVGFYLKLTPASNGPGRLRVYTGPYVLSLENDVLSTGTELSINTKHGERKVMRNNTSMMHNLGAGSKWPMLASSSVYLTVESPVLLSAISFHVVPLYWGV